MKKIILSLSIFGLALSACQSLDVAPPNSITNEQIQKLLQEADDAKANSIISAIGTGLETYFNFGGTYDGGYSHIYKNTQMDQEYILGLMGNDVIAGRNGVGDSHRGYYEFSSDNFFDKSNSNPWWDLPVDYYFNANKVLDTATEEAYAQKKKVVGPYRAYALVTRAWGYLNLIEKFAPAYAVDPTAKGLPIYTEYKVNPVAEISSIEEVYTKIIGWLEEAETIMTDTEVNIGYTPSTEDIDLGLCQYLLMRAYVEHKDWKKAITVGEKIAAAYPTFIAAANYGAKASDIDAFQAKTKEAKASDNAFLCIAVNPETIFGFANGSTYNAGSRPTSQLYWTNMYYLANTLGTGLAGSGQVGPRIDDRLYNKINANDVRKDIFTTAEKTFTYLTTGTATSDGKIDKYASTKWGATIPLTATTRTTDKFCDDIIVRSSEVYLMLAEAYYNDSNTTQAKATLNKLLAARSKTGTLTCDNYGGETDLGKQIQLQWRIEMWNEKGLEFFNNKRWNINVDRSGSTVHNSAKTSKAIADMVFEAPQDEQNANTNWQK